MSFSQQSLQTFLKGLCIVLFGLLIGSFVMFGFIGIPEQTQAQVAGAPSAPLRWDGLEPGGNNSFNWSCPSGYTRILYTLHFASNDDDNGLWYACANTTTLHTPNHCSVTPWGAGNATFIANNPDWCN